MALQYELTGSINSTSYGYKKILDLYRYCRAYRNQTIMVGFEKLIWIDANMSAVLSAVLYKLRDENNVKFYAGKEHADRFPILIANGFFKPNGTPIEVRSTGTEVRLKEFNKADDQEYFNYIDTELLSHEGIKLDEDIKNCIIECLIEVFGNFEIHAKNEYPLFICGQYYPKKREFKCTIQDLGVGFLKPVFEKHPNIDTYEKAIKWALVKGNTSRTDTPGGLGMEVLKDNMISLGGRFEVISGNCYYICGYENGKKIDMFKTVECDHVGSTINLVFSK